MVSMATMLHLDPKVCPRDPRQPMLLRLRPQQAPRAPPPVPERKPSERRLTEPQPQSSFAEPARTPVGLQWQPLEVPPLSRSLLLVPRRATVRLIGPQPGREQYYQLLVPQVLPMLSQPSAPSLSPQTRSTACACHDANIRLTDSQCPTTIIIRMQTFRWRKLLDATLLETLLTKGKYRSRGQNVSSCGHLS
eukprot:COSAG02_NODE_5841_length_3995_cov_2.348819_3_plen_192_part_00